MNDKLIERTSGELNILCCIKTGLIRIALLISVLLLWNSFLYGQNTGGNPTLTSFSTQRVGDHVKIDWSIRAGFSCTSVYVMYSTDSITFVPIYEYPGICGASSEDQGYSFTHTSPSSGKNYYKMELGSYGTSAVVLVNMVMYGSDGMTITTGQDGKHNVYFNNPESTPFTLELFDESGKQLYRREQIQGDHAEIPEIGGKGAIMILRITCENGTIYTGKYTNGL